MAVEDDYVADSEELYRKIPVSLNLYDPALKAPPSPKAFRPNPERDTTGLSVFRAKDVSPEQLCQNTRDKQYYVAVMRAGDLRKHGLNVVAVPVEDMPGHAEIPDLKSDNRKTTEELQLLLAHKLCHAVIGPFPRRAMNTDTTRERRSKSTLVYDGECPFCRKWVRRIGRRDRNGALELVARQTEGLTERFPRLDEADFNTGMRLITPDDVIHVGADAAYQIARRLPFWRRIAWFYYVPGIHWLTRAGYAWIAAHRQSLGGKCDDETCGPT